MSYFEIYMNNNSIVNIKLLRTTCER